MLAAPAYLKHASAQDGKEVNIWTYANFVPDDFKAAFEAETGIKVNIRLVDDQGKQFNLLAAEAPNPTADIVTVAGHRFLQFIDSGLLAPMDTGRLGNWGNINPVYSESDWATINGEKWGAPILSGAEVMAYNTEVVTPEEALSWDVMFDEKYSGQIAYIIQDMMSVLMLYKGYDGNMVEYMDDPDEAARIVTEIRDLMIEHKPAVRKYYDAGAEVQQMFINQDIVLAHAWNGPISKLIMDGFPVAMTIPKEGSYGFVYTLNVANNATERRQRLYLPRRALGKLRGRRPDDQVVGLHLHLQRCVRASDRARTEGLLLHRRRARRSPVLPRRGQRHEVQAGRSGG